MTSGFSTLIFYMEYLGFIGFYLIFQLVYQKHINVIKIIDRCLFLVLVFIFNLWWFFPMYLGLHDVYTKAEQIGTTIYFTLASQLSNLLNATRLIGLPPMQTPLFSWENLYVTNHFFTFILFLFPFCILLLAFNLPKLSQKGTILFLFTNFIFLLFIVKEANPPFSFILNFAFNHVPYFGVFRDSYQKAGLFYEFVYFMLFSIALAFLYVNYLKKRALVAIVLMVLSIVAAIIMTGPFFIFQNIPFRTIVSGNRTLTFSAKTKIPAQYYSLKNFLQPICQQTTVLVLPRTSILSSGYWPNTGYSYIGQDILSNLIDCNFISTQLLDNDIDAFYSVPYVAISQGDISTFKNMLVHSDIQLLVVRHDYISNAFTDYAPVDVNTISRTLNNDHDFERIYGNKLFDVYKFRPLAQTSYGFSFSQATVFTNADFTSGRAIQMLFHALLPVQTFINSSNTFMIRNQENVAFANCIGCEYLPGSGPLSETAVPTVPENSKSLLLKKLLHRKTNQVDSLDNEVNSMDISFNSWLAIWTIANANNYIAHINSVLAYYNKSNSSDFFKNDYNTIEVKNYLLNENTTLIKNKDTFVHRAEQNKIYQLQINALSKVDSNLWETDFIEHRIRYRLDVAQTNQYVCSINSNNKLISAQSVTIDGKKVAGSSLLLQKGSYKVEATYVSHNIMTARQFAFSGSSKMKLSGFTPGSYYQINLQTPSIIAQDLRIIISDRNVFTTSCCKASQY
jgi:hypothetical protein